MFKSINIKETALKRFLFAALALSVLPGNTATAQTANATSGVDIIQPLSITVVNNSGSRFDFGKIAPSTTAAGTVRLVGQNQECVNVTCLGGSSQWRVDVYGEPNRMVVFTLPATITVSNGQDSMLINDTVIRGNHNGYATGTGNVMTVPLSSNGSWASSNLATLNVGQNQAPGAYTGSYVVTAEYQ